MQKSVLVNEIKKYLLENPNSEARKILKHCRDCIDSSLRRRDINSLLYANSDFKKDESFKPRWSLASNEPHIQSESLHVEEEPPSPDSTNLGEMLLD